MTMPPLDRWMSKVPSLDQLRIDQMILPGSHHSGADNHASIINAVTTVSQDVSILGQLEAGVRVLDLRVRHLPERAPGDPKRFRLYHMKNLNRCVETDVLDAVNRFYDAPMTRSARANELIILNFHDPDNFSNDSHEELRLLISKKIGARLIPSAYKYANAYRIWNEIPGRTVVISYNRYSNRDYWSAVQQQWNGENHSTAKQLKAFMDKVALAKPLPYALRSIRCATPDWDGAPTDLSAHIDNWFHSENIDSYIQRFNVISTDWITRNRLVQNCAHANQLKASYLREGLSAG